jgi:hypothetical protein
MARGALQFSTAEQAKFFFPVQVSQALSYSLYARTPALWSEFEVTHMEHGSGCSDGTVSEHIHNILLTSTLPR